MMLVKGSALKTEMENLLKNGLTAKAEITIEGGRVILADEEKLYHNDLVTNNDFLYGLIAVAFRLIGLLLLFFVNPFAAQMFFMTGGLATVAYYHLVVEPIS